MTSSVPAITSKVTAPRLIALGTHSDWVASSGAWGKPGHQRIVDFTKAAGIRRVYWRTHDGGQACYPSKVCSIMDGRIFRDPNFNGYGTLPKSDFAYATHIDYSHWDQISDMIEIGAESGLDVCLWYTFLEDDHGGIVPSKFLEKNPRFRCTMKSGEQVPGCLDFWYPEVREYKLAIVRELLQRPARRLLLDFLRRNGLPSAGLSGHFRYGYNPEIVAGFRAETGLDAARLTPDSEDWQVWLDYNARPLTDFLREVKTLASAAGVAVDCLVWPVLNKQWLAFDLEAAAREHLVEFVLIGSHRYVVSANEARLQIDAIASQVEGDRSRLVPGMFGYDGLISTQVDEFIAAALSEGCVSVALHESNQTVASPIADCLRAWSLSVPHIQREVHASPASQIQANYKGLIPCYGSEKSEADQATSFAVTYTEEGLSVRVSCAERCPERLIPVPEVDPGNFNAKVLGIRLFWNPYESVHLFLDPQHSHQEYLHFCLDPEGKAAAGGRLNEGWSEPWQSKAQVEEHGWTAVFHIPWRSLGVKPESGLTMGFQLVRVQNAPREVSSWFLSYGRTMNPSEFGHLVLD